MLNVSSKPIDTPIFYRVEAKLCGYSFFMKTNTVSVKSRDNTRQYTFLPAVENIRQLQTCLTAI